MEPTSLAPVAEGERIGAIDTTRGFALLGILVVNMQYFGEPFGTAIDHVPPRGGTTLDVGAFYIEKVLCEGKFYPLFSLLFGVGLAVQWSRAAARGRGFLAPGFRRLGALAVMGMAHGLLLWYGDILFVYATAGVWLLLMVWARARTLVLTAVPVYLWGTLLATLMGLLMVAGGQGHPPGTDSAERGPAPAAALAPDGE
ncbi:MAG: hypothetical protein WD749_10180, partial [Phycisphaerales bacterium]